MKKININKGWHFRGAGQDKAVHLPHDFMLATNRYAHSPTGADYGYFSPCEGNYFHHFTKTDAKRHLLKFDGVMGVTEVYVNGDLIKSHPYGYTAFICDMTPWLKDGDNELRVRVDANAQPGSRWYTGAGIYRDVELLTSDEDYFEPFGTTAVISSINGNEAICDITTEIYSATTQKAKLVISIPELNINQVKQVWLEAGANKFIYKVVLKDFTLWSVDEPKLYDLTLNLETANATDCEKINLGIRTVLCDAERGFLLNGEPIKLYGTCNHHDNGIVGSASYRSAEERRVRILKENGFNAIRCAHNPPSEMLLDVCDKMGMLVIDEIFDCWVSGKRNYDYHLWFDKHFVEDTISMVKRDRNHASVVMWSTGNEIFERGGKNNGYTIGKKIAQTIKEYDASRPLTHAFCHFWDNWEYGKKMDETADYPKEQMDFWCETIAPQAANLEVLGYNYMTHRVEKDAYRFPDHLIAITESYPLDVVFVKREMDKHTQLIGEFVWTGWDYFGETGLGHLDYDIEGAPHWGLRPYPEHISNCGDFSITGFKKPASYLRDAAWKKGSVHVFAQHPDNFGRKYSISGWGFFDVHRSWTFEGCEGKPATVQLYSIADECELIVNGVSLGKKAPDYRGVCEFEVPYEKGSLEARAYINGELTGTDYLCTTEEAVKLELIPDVANKSGNCDLVYVEVALKDKNGNLAWGANNEVSFSAVGGDIIGTGSGKVNDEHDYTTSACNADNGRVLAAILPESDVITVTVKYEELEETIEIKL